MSDKTWIMNCVLWGVEVSNLLREGKREQAREKLAGLTSELQPDEIDYLLKRIEGLSN